MHSGETHYFSVAAELLVCILCRKRMNTDPRILTGQKGASTLTQWYDKEITGVKSEDRHLFGSCTEINGVCCILL